jgi:inhibitor of cysteine peptidase
MADLTLADDGATVDVAPGETLSLRLPENATTGYRWEVDSLDEAILELIDERPSYPKAGVGGGGEVNFVVRALVPGSAELRFKQWRAWEGQDSVIGRFAVRVNVRPA